MHALETGPALYRSYFLKKWKRALFTKQNCFPELYNFQHLQTNQSLMEITRHLVQEHTDFDSIEDYFDSYTLRACEFEDSQIQTDIILAADDPVIPLAGTESFTSSRHFRLRIFPRGGHCGFIQNWRFESWLDQELTRLFETHEVTHCLSPAFTQNQQGNNHDIQ